MKILITIHRAIVKKITEKYSKRNEKVTKMAHWKDIFATQKKAVMDEQKIYNIKKTNRNRQKSVVLYQQLHHVEMH